MTISINHPQSDGFLNKYRMTGAALVAAALLSVGLYTQVDGNESVRSASADPAATTADRSAGYDHFVSINEIPWTPLAAVPATTTVDQQAILAAELDAIRAGSNRTVAVVDQQTVLAAELDAIRAGSDRTVPTVDGQPAEFLSMNEIPWAPTTVAPATDMMDSTLAYFLSINDVDG